MTMILGIGADIVEIERMRRSLDRFGDNFAHRVLTHVELAEFEASAFPERLLAKRFAAKEAVVKAMGVGFRDGLALNLIAVVHDHYGKPQLAYQGAALAHARRLGIVESLISISDEQRYAVAFVVLTGAGS